MGISPGQACVFYSKDEVGDKVLGGGWIDKTFNKNLSTSMKGFVRVDNIFDKAYAERADFNAFGGDRYFPGLPREFYVGIEYTF